MREKEVYKERQKLYRQELDIQKQEIEKVSQKRSEAGMSVDKEIVEISKDFAKKAAEIEQEKLLEKKKIAQTIMEENIKEKRKAILNQREQIKKEDQVVQDSLKKVQEEEERKLKNEKDAKKRLINALQMSYAVQGSLKKQQTEKEKELDRKFLAISEAQSDENEKNRLKVRIFFNFLVF